MGTLDSRNNREMELVTAKWATNDTVRGEGDSVPERSDNEVWEGNGTGEGSKKRGDFRSTEP